MMGFAIMQLCSAGGVLTHFKRMTIFVSSLPLFYTKMKDESVVPIIPSLLRHHSWKLTDVTGGLLICLQAPHTHCITLPSLRTLCTSASAITGVTTDHHILSAFTLSPPLPLGLHTHATTSKAVACHADGQ
jgi:hypothetical protein